MEGRRSLPADFVGRQARLDLICREVLGVLSYRLIDIVSYTQHIFLGHYKHAGALHKERYRAFECYSSTFERTSLSKDLSNLLHHALCPPSPQSLRERSINIQSRRKGTESAPLSTRLSAICDAIAAIAHAHCMRRLVHTAQTRLRRTALQDPERLAVGILGCLRQFESQTDDVRDNLFQTRVVDGLPAADVVQEVLAGLQCVPTTRAQPLDLGERRSRRWYLGEQGKVRPACLEDDVDAYN